jgi:hypothetical protein
MKQNADGKRARLWTITGAATVFAVLFLLLLTAAPPTATGLPHGEVPGASASAVRTALAVPDATPATQIYINRSQTSGSYVAEYIQLNNSSTLHAIPYSLTSIDGCRWVQVVNESTAVGTFHAVVYNNVTKSNGTSMIVAQNWQSAFDVCAGAAVWVNYDYWTYGIYDFSTATLGASGKITVTFGKYPGSTAIPNPIVVGFDNDESLALKVSSNLTFTVAFPLFANSTNVSTSTGGSHFEYEFVSATYVEGTTVNKTGTVVFGKGYASLASATWSNWSIAYTNTTVTFTTPTGAFILEFDNFWQTWIVDYAVYWIFGIIIAVVLLAVYVGVENGRKRRA